MNNKLSIIQQLSFIIDYYGEWQLRKLYQRRKGKKLRSKRYAGRTIISNGKGNQALIEELIGGKPLMAGRIGGTEMFAMAEVLRSKSLHKSYDYNRLKDLNTYSGFTQTDSASYEQFTDLMIDSLKQCDLIGVWYNQMENWVCRNYMNPKGVFTDRKVYDFWNCEEPFTTALKNKRVVVIHPFKNTIEKQYRNHEKLFANSEVLPDMELRVVKAVQTLANTQDERFENWFEALEYMYEESMKEDFDVALIGCGAYGFPLAYKLKMQGKQAIHMGGVLQILFGIKGKRWDDIEDVRKLYNDYWTYPMQEDYISGYKKIEGGCYW